MLYNIILSIKKVLLKYGSLLLNDAALSHQNNLVKNIKAARDGQILSRNDSV